MITYSDGICSAISGGRAWQACTRSTPERDPGACPGGMRDGGIPGVVIRLPAAFGKATAEGNRIRAGAAALDANVARLAADKGIAGLEFLRGIPGTIGGALRMNAGCYGSEIKDILVEATALAHFPPGNQSYHAGTLIDVLLNL